MKLIFALGNLGTRYAATRHNVGFQILNAYVEQHDASFTPKPKFFADISEVTIEDEKIVLAKPTTFYNEAGKSARSIADFYKLNIVTDVLVVHDDLALPFGTLRTREKGSDGGNNGIKSLNTHLGPDYARLRVGVYTTLRDKIPDADFVLSAFTSDEMQIVKKSIIPTSLELIDAFTANTHQNTSHHIV